MDPFPKYKNAFGSLAAGSDGAIDFPCILAIK